MKFKEISALTIPHDPDEPHLIARIYRHKLDLYLKIECEQHSGRQLGPLNMGRERLEGAERVAKALLHIIQGTLRVAAGRNPDLPEHMKDIEKELPAYLNYVSIVGPMYLGWN